MAVDLAGIELVYNKFMDTTEGTEGLVLQSVQEEYTAGRIKGPEYATVYLGVIEAAMQLSISSVQAQEELDLKAAESAAQLLIMAKQLELTDAELLLKAKELDIRTAELAVKQYELDNLLPIELLKATAQANLLDAQVLTEAENTALVREKTESEAMQNMVDGVIETQIDKLIADVAIAEENIELAKAQASKEYVLMLATIDKEYGYSYSLDVNDDIIKNSLLDTSDGKIDAEIAKMEADVEIALEQVEIAKANVALERAKTIASIDKEYGYAYTIDGDGNIVIGADETDGKLDAEILAIQAGVSLTDQKTLTETASTELVEQKIVGRKQ